MKSSAILACQVILVTFGLGQSYAPSAGYVPDSATAIKIAEAVLVPIYGQKQIESERPFTAKLEKDVWIVNGTLHCTDANGNPAALCFGGAAVVQLSKQDARIISMTHYK